jgi:anti-sigma-K factor RskA
MSVMNLDDAQDRSVAAAEYVMGTLAPEELAAFTRRLADDPALAQEVYAWQDRLLGLAARVPAVEPSAALWSRIDAALAATPVAAPVAAPAAAPVAAPAAAPGAAPRARRTDQPSFWNRLATWRLIGSLATVASVVLATVLLLRMGEPALAPQYLALLQDPQSQVTGWVVQGTVGRPLQLVPVTPPQEVPAGRVLQFWTKPADAPGPTSLGLVQPGTPLQVPSEQLPGLADQTLFEITLEPEGGSPTGLPTGPILYIGRAVRI